MLNHGAPVRHINLLCQRQRDELVREVFLHRCRMLAAHRRRLIGHPRLPPPFLIAANPGALFPSRPPGLAPRLPLDLLDFAEAEACPQPSE